MRTVWLATLVSFFVFGAPILGGLTIAGTNQKATHETIVLKSTPAGTLPF